MENNSPKPMLGLALSGASSRSVFYVGFLEALKESEIQIDYIAANSGSCIVAAAYACGTLDQLRDKIFVVDKQYLLLIFVKSKETGGLFSMDRAEEELRIYTKNYKFEEVKPLMGFTCTNINTGEEVVLSIGDIARAICASSALPGIFKPIRWGSWDLVDGGLINTVPGRAARQAGCDVVVGVDLSPRPRVFGKLEIGIKKIFDFFYWVLFLRRAKLAYESLIRFLEKNDYLRYFLVLERQRDEVPPPGMFEVLGKAIDISIAAEKKNNPRANDFGCDLLIRPSLPKEPLWKRLKHIYFASADLGDSRQMYLSGKAEAQKHLPAIKKLLEQRVAVSGSLPLAEESAGLK